MSPGTDSHRFGYSVVAAGLHDHAEVARLTAPVRDRLAELGGLEAEVDDRAPHLFVVATGGTERSLLELVARRHRSTSPEPAVLVAHGGHNSLPAALEALAALRQQGQRGRIAYLPGDDTDPDVLEEAVVDLEVVARLRSTRLGLVGGASDWLVASSPSAEVVRRRWGPMVELVEPGRLVEAVASVSDDEASMLGERFRGPATSTTVTSVAVRSAAEVGVALADLVERDGLDAVSVRCFDLLDRPGTSGCVALAALNDDGVVAGCEGDLPSTLAMLWARHLVGRPSWMANPAQVEVAANRLVLAHCTIAPSLTAGWGLATHFESGAGVGIGGHLAAQPVTLLRIGGRELDEVWIADADVVAGGDDPHLCRTQATVELVDRRVDELLDRPLGNHLTVVPGHHAARFERWWRLTIA